ncbi:cancer-related nucleoside-triphosphatase-like [Dendronephthya gigantea]|uniref:cancer-related nucleoside-triphosphatase-like n=1 Tax=Dendronephthya gigantea TaxID=151771 RepID=UPI00106D896F|nr:cancer-related nucleoside-triphosphatase-like [Dendronephthya gigantea]
MATGNIPRHVVLTGLPGTGKTTLIQKACDVLQKKGVTAQGFYTEEVRQHGKRFGFDVITLDGTRDALARVGEPLENDRRRHRVGQYTVNLQSFERIALPALKKKSNVSCVFVIDEIGKMEMFSESFVREVRDLLNNPRTTVLTSIPVARGKHIPFVEEIRHRKDVVLYQITKANREQLLEEIVQSILQSHEHYHVRSA